MNAAGIHISEHSISIVCVEQKEDQYHLNAIHNQQLDTAFRLEPENTIPQAFIDTFKSAIDTLPTPIPSLSFGLTGGQYHIQKVPLEVAGDDEQQTQIEWESSQALISPPQDAIVDFLPAGRIAFWTAIRNSIINVYETLCDAAGLASAHYTVEPLALFYAGIPANIWANGRQTAIHSAQPWSSFISIENGLLTTAETTRCMDHTNTQAQLIQQWISDNLTGSSRRPPSGTIYVSSTEHDQSEIMPATDVQLIDFPTFQGIHTANLPNQNESELQHPNRYAIALGTAIHSLYQSDQS